jgi:hypothetical protein
MIKIENVEVMNFEGAIRGMRNPLNSWDKSDSYDWTLCVCKDDFDEAKTDGKIGKDSVYEILGHDAYTSRFNIGKNDLALMQKLVKSGSEHRKFMRQIFVCADFTAPLYWWKEMSQYRIGCTTDSCSTMHTIHKKEFELDDFSHEHLFESSISVLDKVIDELNEWRAFYLESKNKKEWWQLIQLLPSSYNQKRTWTGSYENLFSMYHQRKNHRLDEWREFCDWILTLPYMKELIGEEDGQN